MFRAPSVHCRVSIWLCPPQYLPLSSSPASSSSRAISSWSYVCMVSRGGRWPSASENIADATEISVLRPRWPSPSVVTLRRTAYEPRRSSSSSPALTSSVLRPTPFVSSILPSNCRLGCRLTPAKLIMPHLSSSPNLTVSGVLSFKF